MYCRQAREFGRVRERRPLRVGVGKSKVTRCSTDENVGQMDVRLNCKPLDEVVAHEIANVKVMLLVMPNFFFMKYT